MTHALHPQHANYDFSISGARGLVGRRVLDRYAYAANGNVHNPTPYYSWLLLVDGRLADRFNTRRELIAAASNPALDYRA